ncbi:hypothetical protein CYMTET_45151, partial [Cymbomonas tetramitiformis]
MPLESSASKEAAQIRAQHPRGKLSPSHEVFVANMVSVQCAMLMPDCLELNVQLELGVTPVKTGSQINSLLESGPHVELLADSAVEGLEELEVRCDALPLALGKRARRQEAEVASELRKVRRTTDAVAYTVLRALASPGQTSARGAFDSDVIGHVVESLIDSAAKCAKSSELRGRLICVLHCANRLLTAAMTSSGLLSRKLVASWQEKLGALRKVCAQMQVASGDEEGALGGAVLELSLIRLETHLPQLPQEDEDGNAVNVAFNVVVGLCKSLAMMKLDDDLATGLQQVAGLAADATRQVMTKRCYTELALMDQLAVGIGGLPADALSAETVSSEVMRYLENLQEWYFHRREGGEWEPKPGRWEPKAAFAELLAEVALGALPPAMLWRICLGDEKFIGLSGLMSLGVSATWHCVEPGMVHLTRWAEMLLLPSTFSFSKWQDEGLRILSIELRQVAEETAAGLAAVSSELLGASVNHATGSPSGRLEELSTQLHSARSRREAEELLARSGDTLDALCRTLTQVAGAASGRRAVCRQASKFLRKLGAGRVGDSRSSFKFLRSALEARVRAPLLGEEGRAAVQQTEIRQLACHRLSERMMKSFATLHEWLGQAVRELPARSGSWGELVTLAPGLEAALADMVHAPRDVVCAVRIALEHGAAMLAGFLKVHAAHQADPTSRVTICAAYHRLLRLLQRCASGCKNLEDAVEDAEVRWREELEVTCCEAVRSGASCGSDSSATSSRGCAGAQLDDIVQKIVAESIGMLLPAVNGIEADVKGVDGLLHELSSALEGIAQGLGGPDANSDSEPSPGASELGPLVEPLAVRAEVAESMLVDLACHARRCAEAIELHVSAPLNNAQEVLSGSLPCRGTPAPANVLQQSELPDPVEAVRMAGAAQRVLTCVSVLQQLEHSLLEDPCAGGVTDHLVRSLPQMEHAGLDSVAVQSFGSSPHAEPTSSEPPTAEASVTGDIGCIHSLCGGLLALSDAHSPLPEGVAMDEATERFKNCLAKDDRAAGTVQDAANAMKVEAVALLEAAGNSCSIVAATVKVISDVRMAIAAPMLGLMQEGFMGEVVRSYQAGRPAEVWRVREVAAVGVMCVLDGLQRRADILAVAGDGGGADPAPRAVSWLEKSEEMEEVREVLQSKVMRCWTFEPFSAVRAVLAGGDVLASRLNAYRGVAAEEQGPEEEAAAVQRAAAAREDRRWVWSITQSKVKQEVEARLKALGQWQREADQATDVLQKQELLVRCREEQAALAQAARNVHDVGTALGMLFGFLRGLDAKLDCLGQNLDELQAGVRVLGADLKRLVGRPVLEELGEQRDRRRLERCRLRDVVYIPAQGVRADVEGKFELDVKSTSEHPEGSNPSVDLLAEVREEFLQSKKVNMLLLSGPAGAGKSTFVEVLEHFLETEYAEEQQGKAGAEVCLLKVSLPSLQNPLTDLFGQALRQKGLREAQIQELRDLARMGKVRLIFLLDAYDELPSQCLFKNLYMSNNLEQYRAQAPAATTGTAAGGDRCSSEGKSTASKGELGPAYPKVIITTRTELLSQDPEYERYFVPVEMDTFGKASTSDARQSFLELRIAPFNDQVDPYIHAKVALEVRRELGRKFGDFDPLSKQTADALEKAAIDAWAPSSLGAALGTAEHPQEPHQVQALVHAACQAVMASGKGRRSHERKGKCAQQNATPSMLAVAAEAREGLQLVWVLAGALRQKPPDLDAALRKFCEQLTKADDACKVWLYRDYRQAFDAIPELKELTTTPFMVEIVMGILPELAQMRDMDALMKSKLLLLLEEDAAQTVWGCISRWRRRHPEDADTLMQVQTALDNGTAAEDERAGPSGLASLGDLAKDVTGRLRAKDILLKQPKLVEIALEHVMVKRKAGGDMENARWSRWRTGWRAAGALSISTESMPEDQPAVDKGKSEMVGQNSVAPEDGTMNVEVVGTICSVGIPFMLKNTLRRPKVRRSHIYDMFTTRYVEREAHKAIMSGTVDVPTVEREGKEYAQRLALAMVSENVSKVPMASSSELFHEESVWDPFLRGGGELRAAAQKAAPVKCDGGMLAFIHKTVQEYLCAASLRAALRAAWIDLAVPLEQLEEHLQSAVELAASGGMGGAGAGEGSPPSGGTDSGVGSVQPGARTAAPGADKPPEVPRRGDEQQKHRSEGTRAAKALQRVAKRLLKSGWAQVDLRGEAVVRDFLTDLFLDDLEFAAEVSFVARWSQQLFDS